MEDWFGMEDMLPLLILGLTFALKVILDKKKEPVAEAGDRKGRPYIEEMEEKYIEEEEEYIEEEEKYIEEKKCEDIRMNTHVKSKEFNVGAPLVRARDNNVGATLAVARINTQCMDTLAVARPLQSQTLASTVGAGRVPARNVGIPPEKLSTFNIQLSTKEDARRAFIYSEIFNRKYE